MKLLNLPLMGLSALLFWGCQKGEEINLQEPSTTQTAASQLVMEPLSYKTTNCLGYDFQLDVDKTSQPGYTIFTWTITNPNPGSGKNSTGKGLTIQNLSHWDFVPSQCMLDSLKDLTEAAVNTGSGWQPLTPLPAIEKDNAMSAGKFNCTTDVGVFKFNYGTTDGAPTQYKIVMKGNWGTGDMNAYFKSGTATGCCQGTFSNMGVGCKIIEVDACSFSQGYWFSNNAQHPGGVHPWKDPETISIGGHMYTNAQGIAIWNVNAGTDAKSAFSQLSALKLSKVDYTHIPALAPSAAIIESWLSAYGAQLTSSNLHNQSQAEKATHGDAKAAANTISLWIQTNHCE